jgi:lipoate synthase
MSKLLTIATFCQEAECDKDIEVSATLYMPANRVEYICSYCGVKQGQDNWLEGAGV